MRCEEQWKKGLELAQNMALELNISTDLPQERHRKLPRRLDDGIVEAAHVTPEDNLRVSFFYAVLDSMLTQLNDRFPIEVSDTAFLLPLHMDAIDGEKHIHRFASRYHQVDAHQAVSQWRLMRHEIIRGGKFSGS